MAHVCFHERKCVHTRLSEKNRTQGHTRRNRWYLRWGWYHYPRSVPHVSEPLRGQGVERQTLPLLGLGRRHSRRTQRAFGTAMRSCASLFRDVAAPLGCVIFFASAEIATCTHCSKYFFGSPNAPACAVPVQALFQLALFQPEAVQGLKWIM